MLVADTLRPPRTYIAKRLFEHGPLTEREFRQITGWTAEAAHSALCQLLDTGILRAFRETGTSRNLYALQ
jgi:hypothetical protein